MMICLKAHSSQLSAECVEQHPCLRGLPASSEAMSGSVTGEETIDPTSLGDSCEVLEYTQPSSPLVINLRNFLNSVRSGRILNPLKKALNLVPPRDWSSNPFAMERARLQREEEILEQEKDILEQAKAKFEQLKASQSPISSATLGVPTSFFTLFVSVVVSTLAVFTCRWM